MVIVGYPKDVPRLVAVDNLAPHAIVEAYAASSPLRRAVHRVLAGLPTRWNPWVGDVGPTIRSAWQETLYAVAFRGDSRLLHGVISSPGGHGRIAIIDPLSKKVYKTYVQERGEEPLRQEIAQLRALSRISPELPFPEFEVVESSRLVLVVERFGGPTPRWNDHIARDLVSGSLVVAPTGEVDFRVCPTCLAGLAELRDLSPQASVRHGDLTPWNCRIEAGRVGVFDWEFADLDHLVPRYFNDLEWVLRGAAASGERLDFEAMPDVARAFASSGRLGTLSTASLVIAYLCNSWRAKSARGRATEDLLLRRLMSRAREHWPNSECESLRGFEHADFRSAT